MPIFKRQNTGSIVAAASDVSTSDPEQIMRVNMTHQAWQHRAFYMFRSLAEIHFPASYIGSALGRFSYPVGIIPADDRTSGPAEPPPSERNDVFLAAEDIMFALEGDLGGISEMSRLYGINMTLAADGWLAGEDRGKEGINWEFLSVEELRATAEGTFQRFSVRSGVPDEGYKPAVTKRFWRPDPFRTQLADSAMSALMDDCERLLLLNASLTSRITSKLANAGILAMPSSMSLVNAVQAPEGDRQLTANPFMVSMLDKLQRRILDPGGPDSATPMLVQGPAGDIDAIKFILTDRTIDRVEMELRAELRSNLATGIDLPPEVQQGMGGPTRFQAWGITDATFSSHLLPEAQRWCEGLTRVYLWPALREWAAAKGKDLPESEIRRYVVMPDGSSVITRPNAAEDLRQVRDRIAVSDAALRRGAGIDEGDAPDEEERVRQMGVRTNNAYLATFGLAVQDKVDWEKANATTAGVGAPGAGGTPPTRRPTDSSTPPKQSPDKAPNPTSQNPKASHQAEVFAAAASGHLLAAQKKVGATVRGLCEPHPEVFADVKRLPNEQVLSGIDDWEALGLTTAKVEALFLAALEPLYRQLVQTDATYEAQAFVASVATLATDQQHHQISVAQLHGLARSVLSPSDT